MDKQTATSIPWNSTQQQKRNKLYYSTYNSDKILKELWSVNKVNVKKFILYDFIYITFLNDKIIEMEKRLVIVRHCGCGEGSGREVFLFNYNQRYSSNDHL